jgi:hypothetical protein
MRNTWILGLSLLLVWSSGLALSAKADVWTFTATCDRWHLQRDRVLAAEDKIARCVPSAIIVPRTVSTALTNSHDLHDNAAT